MTKARTHSRNAFPSPSSWKYVASLRKSTVMVRFVRVGLAAVPMCHPQVIRSRQRIRHDGGNAWKSQDHREGLRPLPLKSMECENIRTRLPTGDYASTIIRARACLLLPSHPYSAPRGTAKPG